MDMIFSVKPVLLYTDSLLFILIAIGISYVCYARKHEHLSAPWRYLGKSHIAMGSATILLAYLLIAIIDSIHFKLPATILATSSAQTTNVPATNTSQQFQSETISLFDVWVSELRQKSEKTYSAPFATHLYTKETIEREDGSTSRDYPKLKYGGIHLQEGESKSSDIIIRSLPGIIKGLLLTLVLALLIALRTCYKYRISYRQSLQQLITDRSEGNNHTHWRTFVIVAGILFVASAIGVELSKVYHIMGTDKIGESVLYQSLKSIRTGILIGTLTTLVMLPFAIFLGIAAGYFRGWVDDAIQFIYTTLNSIPSVLLIASAILMLHVYLDNNAESYNSLLERADLRLLFLCMILGVTSWTGLCRYLRAESLKLREMDYISSALSMGVGHGTILTRHILPNVMHIVLITVVLDFSGLVLAEAVLAYVQIGVDPTTESWGNMINSARLEMARDPVVWWSLSAAFFFMLVLVLAANLFSDAVRDALDPRGRSHD